MYNIFVGTTKNGYQPIPRENDQKLAPPNRCSGVIKPKKEININITKSEQGEIIMKTNDELKLITLAVSDKEKSDAIKTVFQFKAFPIDNIAYVGQYKEMHYSDYSDEALLDNELFYKLYNIDKMQIARLGSDNYLVVMKDGSLYKAYGCDKTTFEKAGIEVKIFDHYYDNLRDLNGELTVKEN